MRTDDGKISRFLAKHYFLSNFYDCHVRYDGLLYHNAEAAFQAAKCINDKERQRFTNLSGFEAKREGRKVKLRPDWEEVKLDIMYQVCKAKFGQDLFLMNKLLETHPYYLEEGNIHKDTFWGTCYGEGENHLGIILMKIREEIMNEVSE